MSNYLRVSSDVVLIVPMYSVTFILHSKPRLEAQPIVYVLRKLNTLVPITYHRSFVLIIEIRSSDDMATGMSFNKIYLQ
jgi:hypothetical protein